MSEWFSITGLEFIQAVQTPQNSVPLIGHKPTYLRVSVRCGVPVTLTGRRYETGRDNEIIPLNPTVHAKPQGSDRRHWEDTLNFQLDDGMTAPGDRGFTLLVFLASDKSHVVSKTVTVHFSPRIDLHLYGLVWSVKNNSDSQQEPPGPAAPWSDWEGHRRYVENVFPVSSLTIDPIPGIGTMPPNPQTFGNLVESRAWGTEKLKDLPANSIIAILDNWDTGGLHGFADGKRCETQNARDYLRIGVVLAQEVSHCLGLWWHTQDPNGPYPRRGGELGDDDIGLDLSGSQPRLISGAFDFMSYNTSQAVKNWGSAFTYGKLLEAITGGAPGDAADGLPRWHPQGGWEGLGGGITDSPAAVSWTKDRLDIVARGIDGSVYHKYWNGAQWGPPVSGWDGLGGGITDAPTVVSWGSDRLDIFVRGIDGSVYRKYWNGSQWGPSNAGWENLGGGITGSPIAVSWGPHRLDIFARGLDGSVYHKYWNGSQWGPPRVGWENLGGLITGSPVAVSWGPDRLDIFARGLDGGVYHKYWNGTQWGPSQLQWDNLGGAITDSPVAVSWGPGRLDIFVRGLDGTVYHKYWNGSQWGPSDGGWDGLGGQTIGAPSAVSWAKDRLDIFVRGLDDAGYQKAWTGRDWSPRLGEWRLLEGKINGTPVAASWAPNRIDLFVRGKDNGVYHRYRADVPG